MFLKIYWRHVMAGIKSKIAECRQKWENNLKHYVKFKAHSTFIDSKET